MSNKPPQVERIVAVRLYFLPVQTRMPLKFGQETLTSVTCARVTIRVADASGQMAEGWGETPLSVQWAWPGALSYELRHTAMKDFCVQLAWAWMTNSQMGHPLEIGHHFNENLLPSLLNEFNERRDAYPMPRLAALICNSAFDIALHDAFGNLVGKPVYQTYGREYLSEGLDYFLEPARDSNVSFRGLYPSDFLAARPRPKMSAWHLVGALDLLEPGELTGSEPKDGHPVLLADWIRRDGLKCLKVKLGGVDAAWDYHRFVKVAQTGVADGVESFSADFNCGVSDPAYVNQFLDRLKKDQPRFHDLLLYIEQPFPYDLENHKLDVHSVSTRKPLFLDESAHDWRLIRLGRELGWSGVALKTCKTQTGAILSACWAKAHELPLMVQDLTNPMLAQISHVMLAAHTDTIMGIETNACQFYPAASAPEEAVHPGLYQRRAGSIDLSSVSGPGFGYRLDEIHRTLPGPVVELADVE